MYGSDSSNCRRQWTAAMHRGVLWALMMLALFAVANCRVVTESTADIVASTIAGARQLQQALARCPVGCASDGCLPDTTTGGYKCVKCQNRLVVEPADGTCACPAGRYAKLENDCVDCDKGSYCLGGTYVVVGVPDKIDCGDGLTTIGKRSVSIKACVNVPGTFFSLDDQGSPSTTTCPPDSYGPGLRKQRACVPCPPGYITRGATGQTRPSSCVVPEGYYQKGPGQVAPCPMGSWKSGFYPVASCTSCAYGVTTAGQASISEAACTVVLPGHYPSVIANNIVKATERCPQKFFCPGGVPSGILDPYQVTALDLEASNTTQCPDGTWTYGLGSTSPDQCLTPPGHKTMPNNGSGFTEPCSEGEYRPEWQPAVAATSCLPCGEGILSFPAEQITAYDAGPDGTPLAVGVRATVAACYIKPGQGMYFSSATNSFKGVNCDTDSYGVANITFGLQPLPCRKCPNGMMTSLAFNNSARYFATDGADPPRQGFTSPMACVTMPGYGYNGQVAMKCPAGWWNPPGTYRTCTQCQYGTSTPDDASQQVSASNCGLAPGFGRHHNTIVPCPVGTFNDVLRSDTQSPCMRCPVGLTTSQAGASNITHCDLCDLGWGGTGNGTTCNIQCGGTNGPNYGPALREAGEPCVDCPTQTVGFTFNFLATNQLFVPATVARPGADSFADCFNEFVQINEGAWFMGGTAKLTVVSAATSFGACVADCKADPRCQYITFDYDAPFNQCSKKLAASGGSDVVAFRSTLAGDTSGASLKQHKQHKQARAKGLSSGSYTYWLDTGAGIGADQSTLGPTSSLSDCLGACDADTDCAGVVMTGLTSAASTKPTSCRLIKGDDTLATFKRSVTRTVISRLNISAIFV